MPLVYTRLETLPTSISITCVAYGTAFMLRLSYRT